MIRKISKKVLPITLAVAMLFSLCAFSVNAETLPDSKDTIVECANEIKNEYNNLLELPENQVSSEYLTNNYEANITYNKILDYIYSFDDELRSHFSGAYVNDEGYLVVALCCETSECKNLIIEKLECTDVIFEDGVGSYYHTQQELDLINEKIALLQENIVSGEEIREDAKSLMALLPRTSYNSKNNTISVIFNMDSNVESAVKKTELNDVGLRIRSSATQFSETELNSLEKFDNAVVSFENLISDQDNIIFDVCSGYEPIVEEGSEAWRPGRLLIVYDAATSSGTSLSSGYRAKYSYGGTTYYGFVTCAHGTKVGNSVYISTTISSANKLGVILNRSYGGKIDVSFIRMTNSNYTNGNAIYYTSSQPGVTRQGTVLDGTQAEISLNSRIYKSGAKTYLTYGNVANTNISCYSNDIYFYDLFQADSHMSDSGDSGAVTYIVNGATIYGKAVGLVKGRVNNTSVFVKASNIKSVFGAEAY